MSTPETSTSDTAASAPPKPRIGEVFHWLHGGMAYPQHLGSAAGVTSKRGQEVRVTEALLVANTNRLGECWLDLLHDPAGQEQRWGKIMFAPGPFPDGLLRTEPGSYEHEDAKADAYRAARALPERQKRDAALAEVEETYGPQAATSTHLATYSDKK